MESGLLIADREVDAGEIAVQSTRGAVVHSCGIFFGIKTFKMYQFVVDSDPRSPWGRTRISGHALVFRRSTRSLSRVTRILSRCCFPQIFSAVVKTISVHVVDVFRHVRAQEPAVESNSTSSHFSNGVHPSRLRVSIEVPTVPHYSGSVSNVDLREGALRERNEENTSLHVRVSSPSLCLDSYDGASRELPLPYSRLDARVVAACSSTPRSARLAADDAWIAYNRHRSPPSTRSSQAPAGDTARGYFNGGHITCAAD